MSNDGDNDLFTKVMHECAWMLEAFNRGQLKESNPQSRELVLNRIYFEMTDYNEQASWLEKVIVELVLIAFAGPWELQIVERHKAFLRKLLELHNRPLDALEQIANEPRVKSRLEGYGIFVPPNSSI
jgi:hypothetical protein